MKRIAATIVVAALVVTASALVAISQQSPATGRESLAQALKGAWLPLESGLIVGSTQGTPLSAKYEIDDGAFQLSVYTVKVDASAGDAFMEVIVDYSTGMIAESRPSPMEEIWPRRGTSRWRSPSPSVLLRPLPRPS